MVELLIAGVLLVPALVLLWLGFNGKPWAGLFSGLLLLVFGILLLGGGFEYGIGETFSQSGVTTFTNTTYSYQNLSANVSGFIDTVPALLATNVTTVVSGTPTSVSNFTTTKTELTDGVSVLFIFLGIVVMALSLMIIGKNRDTISLKVKAEDSEL